MSGHRKFDAIKRHDRSAASRDRLERLRGLYDNVFGLGRLREARGLSQAQVAAEMRVSQANISRVEHSTDIYLSTAERYIQALGGELHLFAVFPDQSIQLPLTPDSWSAWGPPSQPALNSDADQSAQGILTPCSRTPVQ